MCNIADKYKKEIPVEDWKLLVNVSSEKEKYIKSIIDSDTGPRRKKSAYSAYSKFVQTVCEGEET